MARPRVFVSSTFYDLKHMRASLDGFIASLGFDSILSENGDIPYDSDVPLDESCYREVATADIFVMIIGGRYGSAASEEAATANDTSSFDSISKREVIQALNLDIPVYVLVDRDVYAEFNTYKLNPDTDVRWAHVDSVNVYRLLDDILRAARNNPVQPFQRFSDIEVWLREQWAGLFSLLLSRRAQTRHLQPLSERLAEMREMNETMKSYLEAILSTVSAETSTQIINSEDERLVQIRSWHSLREEYAWIGQLYNRTGLSIQDLVHALRQANSVRSLIFDLRLNSQTAYDFDLDVDGLADSQRESLMEDINGARRRFNLLPIPFDGPAAKRS